MDNYIDKFLGQISDLPDQFFGLKSNSGAHVEVEWKWKNIGFCRIKVTL